MPKRTRTTTLKRLKKPATTNQLTPQARQTLDASIRARMAAIMRTITPDLWRLRQQLMLLNGPIRNRLKAYLEIANKITRINNSHTKV